MILFKKALDLQTFLEKKPKKDNTIGFVPTMGALHAGHISLLKKCINQTGISVCSIFVNPTQFNSPEDFKKYPVTISEDILKLEEIQCDVLFLPSVEEMYPEGLTKATYNFGELENIFEGEYRTGHFQGVGQIVHRLLNIIHPHKIYLGQKDYQQCFIIKKLVELERIPGEVIIEDTLREPTGLAMSSRNMRLTNDEKDKATAIYQCLILIKENIHQISIQDLINSSTNYLLDHGFTKVDYVAIANANTLERIDNWNSTTPLVALIAAYMGDVRLIDNMIVTPSLL